MNETTPVAGKAIPPVLNKRATNSKGPKQAASHEVEHPYENPNQSPPKKKRLALTLISSESPDLFVAPTADARREVNMLLSQFAEVLSERAAADTAQMKELEVILTAARNLESYLKEKKTHLRKTLALISDKLQG